MEQLKPIIKHYFWILSGLVVVAGIGVGIWSWLAMGERINKQKAAILAAESQAKNVMNVKADVGEDANLRVHPNEDTLQGMKVEIDAGRDEVLKAWQELYNGQKDLLGWPGDVIDPQLARHFDAIRAERVQFSTGSIKEEVGEALRKRMRGVLPNLMEHLATSVRAKWNAADITGENSKTPKAVDSAKPVDDMERLFNQPIVTWSLEDQAKWYGLLSNFKGRNGNNSPDGTPTTIQLLYLKEDMVLLNGVLEIIKAANQNANIPRQAAVSEIANIMIGKEAHEAKPLEVGGSGGGSGFMDEADSRMQMMADYVKNIGSGGKSAATEETSSSPSLDPVNMRYVDKDFKPIPAPDYRASVMTNDLSEKSWMAVVKRVPVRLRLKVDERKIPEILEHCANAKIPLEVRQITLIGGDLPKDPAATTGVAGANAPSAVADPSAAGAGAGGSAATAMLDADGGSGRSGGGAAGQTGGAGGGKDSEKTYSSPEFNSHFMVPLEIYGIMKIYNEPIPEALGKSKDPQDAAL